MWLTECLPCMPKVKVQSIFDSKPRVLCKSARELPHFFNTTMSEAREKMTILNKPRKRVLLPGNISFYKQKFDCFLSSVRLKAHRHIVYLICVSNARVLAKSVKIDQTEGIPDAGIPKRPFVKFSHRRSFASSRRAFFIFSRAVFCTALWQTERLEEAISHWFSPFI